MKKTCLVVTCERDSRARGMCQKHYQRFLAGTLGKPKPSTEERFWSKVDRGGEDECWLWTGAIGQGNRGYAKFKADHSNVRVHRYSYELHYGKIPDGMLVDHVCHSRNCVNPSHLRLARPVENSRNRGGAAWSNPSGVRGVSRKGDKWLARVQDGAKTYRKTFSRLEDAAEWVADKRLELFGAFAGR